MVGVTGCDVHGVSDGFGVGFSVIPGEGLFVGFIVSLEGSCVGLVVFLEGLGVGSGLGEFDG